MRAGGGLCCLQAGQFGLGDRVSLTVSDQHCPIYHRACLKQGPNGDPNFPLRSLLAQPSVYLFPAISRPIWIKRIF